jgi:hypothetical protein
MTHFSDGKSKKSMIVAVLAACVVFATVSVAWILTRQRVSPPEAHDDVRLQENEDGMPLVSLEDIARLPANRTLDDVAKLLKGRMFADNLICTCPAKEGGVYMFSFIPTREVSLPEGKGKSERLMLVAVISFPSEEAELKGQGGEYVYPARVRGVKFSGFPPDNAASQNAPER